MSDSSHEENIDVETNSIRLPRKLRRQQLLLSALRVFSSQGYHATTMNHIASAAEITKPVLYQHFKSKQDLYLAVLDDQIAVLSRRLVEPLQEIEINRQKVKGMIQAFFTYALTNPLGYRLIFDSDLQNDVVITERVEKLYESIAEKIAEVLAPNAGLSIEEAIIISRSLLGMVLAATRQAFRAGGTEENLRQAEHLSFRLAWGGLVDLDDDWE